MDLKPSGLKWDCLERKYIMLASGIETERNRVCLGAELRSVIQLILSTESGCPKN